MPHVTLNGPLDLTVLQRTLSPALERTPTGARRLKNAYLNGSGCTLLLETLVMESGISRAFFLRIDAKEPGRSTVRIEPMVAVDRTGGVIDTVAWLARRILADHPSCTLAHSNIPSFEPPGPAS